MALLKNHQRLHKGKRLGKEFFEKYSPSSAYLDLEGEIPQYIYFGTGIFSYKESMAIRNRDSLVGNIKAGPKNPCDIGNWKSLPPLLDKGERISSLIKSWSTSLFWCVLTHDRGYKYVNQKIEEFIEYSATEKYLVIIDRLNIRSVES